MTFIRESVILQGVLSRGSQKANCTVSALRVSLLEKRLSKNCLYSVQWVGKPLPEGDYQLLVEGKTIGMRYLKGQWQTTEACAGPVNKQ
jgi:hypothetical protein